MKLILIFIALVAGMMGPLQAGLNSRMGRTLDDPFYAALISFVVGSLGLLALGVVTRVDFGRIRVAAGIDWYVWLAGLLGAFFVASVIVVTPKIGAVLTFGLVVAGQMIMAVIMDHYGLLEVPLHPFGWQRFLGIALITAGVILIRRY